MADLAPGSVVAGYRIEAVLGRGGMGVVYLATQLSLDRPVALKVIAPELAGDITFRERFKRESRIAASIEHPNVIPVYEAGEGDGLLYLTMRYVDGTDLKALLEANGTLEPARAARLLAQVAAALAAAHRRDLMHRDVKPANVLVDREGGREHGYLTDFGIARHVAATSALTATGSVVGTIDYLAPERIVEGGGDARADVYALGCVLFQVLTGNVPYPRDHDAAKMYAHLNADVPDARSLNQAVPAALAELAMRAMAKEPDARVHSAAELAERLLEAADTREIPAPATLPATPPIPEAPTTPPAEPAGTEPAETAETEPAPTEAAPAAPEPAATEPAATEPAPTEDAPAATEPAATEPAATGPATAPTTGIEGRSAGGLGEFRTEVGTKSAPPRRRGRPGAIIAAAAGVLALIAVVVVLASGGSEESGGGGGNGGGGDGGGSARLNPTALDTIAVQPGADGVATGAGFVWVANRDLNTVTRVNAQSRRVEGDPIQVGQEPDSLAEGLGAMWVTNTSDNSVSRLDLETGEVLDEYPVRARPEGILVAHGAVWVANGADGSVSRLDEEGNELSKTDVGEGPVQLAATTDAVWVTVSKENRIVELDRDSGDLTERDVPIEGTPRGIAYEPVRGELWVSASAADRLVVVDPDSAGVEGTKTTPDNPREVRFGFGAIWVTCATAQKVSAVNPKRREVIRSLDIPGTTYGLAVGEGLVWAASEGEGLLLPIRPRE
jgi:DNA-binding beta-propeller fold protein YncE/outer membrane biosynthesis protein TonB